MPPSQKVAVQAFVLCIAMTAALYWWIETELGLSLPWWCYAIVAALTMGVAYATGIELEANRRIADTDHDIRHKSSIKETPKFFDSDTQSDLRSLGKPILSDTNYRRTRHKRPRRKGTALVVLSFVVGAAVTLSAGSILSWWKSVEIHHRVAKSSVPDLQKFPDLAATQASQKHQICKAAIAAIMGRDPRTMNTAVQSDDVISVSYTRPVDKSFWAYRCKLTGTKVIWATDSGRWRTHELDEDITFVVDESGGVRIKQIFTDGSKDEDYYSADALTSSSR